MLYQTLQKNLLTYVPCDLGFSVLQEDIFRHPYFPDHVERGLFQEVDPVSWKDKNINYNESEFLVEFENLSLY